MGSRGGDHAWKDGGQRTGWARQLAVPQLCADKPEGTTGEQDRPGKPGFQCGEIKPQNLCL